MNTSSARPITYLLFLVVWTVAVLVLYWATTTFLLEKRNIEPDNVPHNFPVVLEVAGQDGKPATYYSVPYRSLSPNRPMRPGESLRLGASAYSDLDLAEAPSSCCIDFRVLEDGPKGQLIEHNVNDMSYLNSRYLVRGNQVVPLSFRSDFSLYYLGYLILGGILALIITSGLRRRVWGSTKQGNKG